MSHIVSFSIQKSSEVRYIPNERATLLIGYSDSTVTDLLIIL